jgi:hypothetical protein
VEKNPSENRTDVAKQLGLPPSTLNTIIGKKNTVHIESLLFNLKWKGATKQMKINDFLKKNAKWTWQWKQ